MKTNRMFTVLRLMVLGMLVAGFNAKAADGPAFQGKFTLTSETRWGYATLPAGDYSFTLDHDYLGGVVTLHRGTQSVARILVFGMSYIKSGRCEIIAENGAVREVNLPQIGVRLDYQAPKSQHRAAPHEPLAARVIPIGAKGAGR